MQITIEGEQKSTQNKKVEQRLANELATKRCARPLDRIDGPRLVENFHNGTASLHSAYFFSPLGVYQIGEVQARCWTVAATFAGTGTFNFAAQ
jgi:hypothetical protein